MPRVSTPSDGIRHSGRLLILLRSRRGAPFLPTFFPEQLRKRASGAIAISPVRALLVDLGGDNAIINCFVTQSACAGAWHSLAEIQMVSGGRRRRREVEKKKRVETWDVKKKKKRRESKVAHTLVIRRVFLTPCAPIFLLVSRKVRALEIKVRTTSLCAYVCVFLCAP